MKYCFLLVAVLLLFPTPALAISPIATPVSGYSNATYLDNKDTSTWATILDERLGTLSYNATGDTFGYNFTATGLEASVAYSLIYYANPYPGGNPGALIGTGTSTTEGTLLITGAPELGISLPTPPDANMLIDHSIAPDFYTNAYGAKIWLVPSTCYNTETKTVSTWSPTRFLFETDVITYTDTNLMSGSSVPATTVVAEPTATIGITVSPTALNFGSVTIGTCSTGIPVTLTNTGNVPIKVTITTTTGYYANCLKANTLTANGWVSPTIAAGESLIVSMTSCPTASYSGTATGTVYFTASFAP